MMTECDGREAALVVRPTQSILRDYQGDNLMLAFPLLFPCGIGAKKADGECRGGPSYYRHLTCLSSIWFQNAAFGAVIHNMAARQKMVSAPYFRNSTTQAELYTGISNKDIKIAAERFTNGTHGSVLLETFFFATNESCNWIHGSYS
jgi:hypothetical protein